MKQVVCKNIRWDQINFWCCNAFYPSENIKEHQEEAHSDIVKVECINKDGDKDSHVSVKDDVVIKEKSSERIHENLDQFKKPDKNNLNEGKGKINEKEICRNFSCLFCDKKFRRKYEAQQCENKHNGIFKHNCDLCEFKTNGKWHMGRHVKFHLNVKPYSCPVCKLKSVTKSDLRYHIKKQHETDGSILPHLEASYPQMYNASESSDPPLQNLVPAKQLTRKRKWGDELSVKYPTIVRSIDRYSPTRKKRKLFSPKSQKNELFPVVGESGFRETPKYSKVLSLDWCPKSLIKHCFKDEKEDVKDITEDKNDKDVSFANESIMTKSSVEDVLEMQNIFDDLREVFNDENLIEGVPPLGEDLGVRPSRYGYSVTEVNQTI